MHKRILSMVIVISMTLAVGCGNTVATPANNEQAADEVSESAADESVSEEISALAESDVTTEAQEEEAVDPIKMASDNASSPSDAYLGLPRKAVE